MDDASFSGPSETSRRSAWPSGGAPWRQLFQQAPALIAVHEGPKHVYIFSNDLHDRVLGRRDIIGKSLLEAMPELEGQDVAERFDRVYATGRPATTPEFRAVLDRSGGAPTEGYLSQVLQPWHDANGEVAGVISFAFEAAEQVRARKKREALLARLREEETRLWSVLEQMPSGVYIAEAPSGRLLFHNEEAVRLLRHPLLPSEDTAGYAQYGALHLDGTAYAPEEYPIARALGGETVHQEEMRYRRGDGTLTTLSVSAAPIYDGAEDRPVFAVSTFEDISRQKAAEEAVRRVSLRLAQAEERERRRVARELHDELGALLTSLHMRLRMNPAQDPAARAELAEAEALTKTLLSKVRQLSLDLRPALLDDLGLVPALEALSDRVADAGRLEIDFRPRLERGERLAPEVETAAYRIVQEAVTNAARHADAERVHVRLRREDENEDEPGRWLLLHVIDEGHGFDVGAARSESASAGLAGMRERAKLLGGRCEITSAPDAGTRVTARLPALPPAPPDA